MATATHTIPDFNGATEQATRLGERIVEVGKRTGYLYLDGYDKFVEGVTDFQQKLAGQSRNETVQSLVETQVALTRDLASAYSGTARELLS
jgi:hypothetical protein